MVDTWLANQLFSNISSNSKILIVGDSDQYLLSVLASSGRPAPDCTDSPDSLRTDLPSERGINHRHLGKIRQGILPADFTQKKADRSYFEIASGHIPATIEKILALPSEWYFARDIQVLAPMYRGTAGIDAINQLCETCSILSKRAS